MIILKKDTRLKQLTREDLFDDICLLLGSISVIILIKGADNNGNF